MIDVPDAVSRARALIEEKQFDEAISLLKECEEACPEDEFVAAELAEAFSDRGYFAIQNKDPESARKDFESALGFSLIPEAKLGLARFEIEDGNFNQAENLVAEILSEIPEFFPAREMRAKLRITLGDLAGAEEEYRAILLEFPAPRVYLALAGLLGEQDRKEEAREVLFGGISEVPDDPELLLAASQYSDPEQRWQLLNRAISVHPQSFDLWFERASAACERRDPEEAALSINKCLDLDENRTRTMWKKEITREGSPAAPYVDHPYLADLLSD